MSETVLDDLVIPIAPNTLISEDMENTMKQLENELIDLEIRHRDEILLAEQGSEIIQNISLGIEKVLSKNAIVIENGSDSEESLDEISHIDGKFILSDLEELDDQENRFCNPVAETLFSSLGNIKSELTCGAYRQAYSSFDSLLKTTEPSESSLARGQASPVFEPPLSIPAASSTNLPASPFATPAQAATQAAASAARAARLRARRERRRGIRERIEAARAGATPPSQVPERIHAISRRNRCKKARFRASASGRYRIGGTGAPAAPVSLPTCVITYTGSCLLAPALTDTQRSKRACAQRRAPKPSVYTAPLRPPPSP